MFLQISLSHFLAVLRAEKRYKCLHAFKIAQTEVGKPEYHHLSSHNNALFVKVMRM